jgi:hypothetical protein
MSTSGADRYAFGELEERYRLRTVSLKERFALGRTKKPTPPHRRMGSEAFAKFESIISFKERFMERLAFVPKARTLGTATFENRLR